jgi:hypothetical protein
VEMKVQKRNLFFYSDGMMRKGAEHALGDW